VAGCHSDAAHAVIDRSPLVIVAQVTRAPPVAVVLIAILMASSKLVDLHEVAVVVDVDVVAGAAFARTEAA